MTDSILTIKGVGEKTAELFYRVGIRTTDELMHYYPTGYDRLSEPEPLYKLTPGKICTAEGVLTKDAQLNVFKGLKIVNAYISDMTGRLQLSWYNFPYVKGSLKAGSRYVFRGRVYEKNGRLIMQQPKIYDPAEYRNVLSGRLLPLYPLTKGLTHVMIRKAVREYINNKKEEREYLPAPLLARLSMSDIDTALKEIHFPPSEERLKAAERRLVFDEFFFFMLMSTSLKRSNDRLSSAFVTRPPVKLLSFIAGLPYELTKPQLDAYKSIARDMSSGKVMNRLIQGDVGSGKTIVAVLAMLNAVLNGYQAVLMAPTEVLAAQHYETVRGLIEAWDPDISCVLLTGSMSAKEKKLACDMIENGEANIVIGTHALIQDKISFSSPGLMVTDEQHRFGVRQRELLGKKGEDPHVLVMSATPIPRTLALMIYGDLDISVIDSMPKGRLPVKNCVVGPGYRKNAYSFIAEEIKKGHQAYVICSRVESSEESEEESGGEEDNIVNVNDYAAKLRKIFPENIRIETLYGSMKSEEKDRVMRDFKEKKSDILVATTVVEVGVDVPNATVIMIENAERFGLAQLHQLRGRVGRGKDQSYCIMINCSDSERAKERLDILNRSNDGFEIAEADLKLRGPGDIFGVRQSGELEFKLGDIYRDSELLYAASAEAKRLLDEDERLERPENREIGRKLSRLKESCSRA